MLTRRKTHSVPGLCCALDLRENPPLQNQLKTRKENTADTSQPEDLAGRPCPSPRPPGLGAQNTGRAPAGRPRGRAAFWRPGRWTQGLPGARPLPPGPHRAARSPPPRALWASGTASAPASPGPSSRARSPAGPTHHAPFPGNRRSIALSSGATRSLCERLLGQRKSFLCHKTEYCFFTKKECC